jgi:hypothetical protein
MSIPEIEICNHQWSIENARNLLARMLKDLDITGDVEDYFEIRLFPRDYWIELHEESAYEYGSTENEIVLTNADVKPLISKTEIDKLLAIEGAHPATLEGEEESSGFLIPTNKLEELVQTGLLIVPEDDYPLWDLQIFSKKDTKRAFNIAAMFIDLYDYYIEYV